MSVGEVACSSPHSWCMTKLQAIPKAHAYSGFPNSQAHFRKQGLKHGKPKYAITFYHNKNE